MQLHIQTLLDIARMINVLPAGVLQSDHSAFHTKDLNRAINHWTAEGYACIRKNDEVALMEKGTTMLELIPRDRDEHFAFTVTHIQLITDYMKRHEDKFSLLDKVMATPEAKVVMYVHIATRQVIQFVERLTPLRKPVEKRAAPHESAMSAA